jgi:hypothetical protein
MGIGGEEKEKKKTRYEKLNYLFSSLGDDQ